MTSPNPAIKFTYQDYINTPDDKRYELIDGELILAPAPRRDHQRVDMRLGWRLGRFVEENALGVAYSAPRDVVFSDTNIVQPDLMFISNERMHIDTESEVWGAPDLVVEILSPSTAARDRTVKRSLYARNGVNEYWLVDADARTIAVMLLGEQGFEPVATYGEGDTLVSPTLPGFSILVDEVF
jgi:Uma2 family endonuclease